MTAIRCFLSLIYFHYPLQKKSDCLLVALTFLGSTRTLQHALELPERLRLSPPVQLALAVNRAYTERNPVRLLRLVQKLDFMQACALHRHLLSCRKDLLLLYSHGHNSRNCRFPIQKLANVLNLECSLAGHLCQAHGIQVSGDCVVFSKASFSESPCKKLLCAQMHKLVDDKQQDLSVGSIIHGIAWTLVLKGGGVPLKEGKNPTDANVQCFF